MRFARVALVIIAVVCFGVALSYPIRYRLAQRSNDADMQELSAMRAKVQQERAEHGGDAPEATATPVTTANAEGGTEAPETAVAIDDGMEAPAAAVTTDGGTEVPAVTVAIDSGTEAPAAAVAMDNGTEVPAVTVAIDSETEAPATTVVADDGGESRMPDATTVAIAGDDAGQAVQPANQDDGAANAVPAATTPEPADGAATLMAESVDSAAAATPESADSAAATTPEPVDTAAAATPGPAGEAATPTAAPTPSPTPGIMDLILDYEPWPTLVPIDLGPRLDTGPTATPSPAPTFDVEGYEGALPYSLKKKVLLDEDAILPELKDIYALNHDLVGWITIDDTVIDYPVVQRPEDSEFYLSHDFYGEENQNGQIILDPLCDPYTPSYNLVISGHHMKNGSMFGGLPEYRFKSYWEKHRFVEFDTLMARKKYVVFAAFYSADYDEDEKGFRYNVNVRYRMDADPWIAEIRENQLYDTGIDVEFGDEFITLTTCNRTRHRNGRFVVVCRLIREGETFE